jgi:hypothetical protein
MAVPGTVQVLDGGYTLIFTPSVPRTPGALIQWWPYDIAGNSFSTSGYVSYNSGYVYSIFTTQ